MTAEVTGIAMPPRPPAVSRPQGIDTVVESRDRSVSVITQFEQRDANVLSGFLDVLHRFAGAGAGGLIPALGLLDVVSSIIDELLQLFIRFHGVVLSLLGKGEGEAGKDV